jgi:hypothetical protein
MDEQAEANDALAAKVKALENCKNAPPPPAPVLTKPTSTSQAAPAKKASKKPVTKPVKKKPAIQSQQ